MAHESERGRTLSVRLPSALNRALQRVADRESNSPSAVARRLIAAGLQREARLNHEHQADASD